jgi:pimeloyl-ACP methyl ester carboxylesterase
VSGSGEPLLLVHGIGGTRRIWDPVIEPLAADFQVIAVDLPGFGDSAPLADGATPDPVTLARVLGELLDARGIEAAHLAGSSLGAWIALELAREGRARSVTSLCAAGFWTRPLLAAGELPRKPGRAIARALLPAMGPLLRTRRGRRLVLGLTMAHPERVSHAEALDIVRAYALAPGYPATNLAMRRSFFSQPEAIGVPVTLAWGEHDRLVRPPRVAPPGWRTVLLRDCGHLPMWDDPELVVRVIRATASAP